MSPKASLPQRSLRQENILSYGWPEKKPERYLGWSGPLSLLPGGEVSVRLLLIPTLQAESTAIVSMGQMAAPTGAPTDSSMTVSSQIPILQDTRVPVQFESRSLPTRVPGTSMVNSSSGGLCPMHGNAVPAESPKELKPLRQSLAQTIRSL